MIGVKAKIEDFDQSEVFEEILTTLLKIILWYSREYWIEKRTMNPPICGGPDISTCLPSV